MTDLQPLFMKTMKMTYMFTTNNLQNQTLHKDTIRTTLEHM